MTEKKIEEAWGPRGSSHFYQKKCFSHRALRLLVDANFLLYFCPCGFQDVFPYLVTLHKMDCFAGETHIVDEDCFPAFVNTIWPVIKKAITLAALDVGFQQLLFTAQQSPLIRSPPTVTTDNRTPLESGKNEPPPQPRPSRLGTVKERLLRLQAEFTQLTPDTQYNNWAISVEGLRGAPKEETACTSSTTQVPIAATARTGLRIPARHRRDTTLLSYKCLVPLALDPCNNPPPLHSL